MATRNAILCLFVLGISAAAGTVGSSAANPSSIPASVGTTVTFTSVIADPTVIASTVNVQQLDSSGRATVVGTMHDDGLSGDAVANDHTFSFQLNLFQQIAGNLTYRVSAGFQGSLARAFSAPIIVSVTGVSTGITITSPAAGAYLNISPTIVTGTVATANSTVKVNNVPAQVTGTSFSVSIPLQEGSNPLTAVATNGGATASASETITLDTTPPHVTIDTPSVNATTTDATINVGGIVNDIVVGTINPLQATVSVNGVAAQVTNRTYIAAAIPLALGANTLTATARDRAGNFATTSVTVTRQTPTQPTLRIISGNNLTGPIRTRLAAPLVVQASNASGQPLANTPVVFTVTGGDGTVSSGTSSLPAAAVNTNSQGQAQVVLTLGSRAGAGNNIVQASAAGISNTAVFTESASSTAPALIVVDSGNNQSGVVGQALPLPFIAIVTDAGNNRLGNVAVSFTVTGGGGTVGGVNAVTATSDSDGRVQAILTLGAQAGINNNVVAASFAGNTGLPATFTATSYVPGPVQNTSITGVVLDNSNNPLAGVTMRLYQLNNGSVANVPVQIGTPVQTNALGYFAIQPAPVGVFKLMADGTTATTPGSYPTLEYDIVTVAGQNNTVGQPIYLPQIASASRLCVSPTVGGTLTIPQAPGFALSIAPGSANFPGGTQTGCVSVTPVNLDKVPMVPGFGQQPRFIVTIQPVGTTFNPPAQITIPNVDGLAPRAVTEMYSYDHDLASFVAIGTGTVSTDGSVIASDPGVGVLKAGWHCGGDPNTAGSAGALGLTASPGTLQGNPNDTFSVTANGTPPLDGTYSWEIISTQAGDDTGVAQLTSAPACASQASCVATLKALKGGSATLRVHFKCTTTGLEATPVDIRITILGFTGVLTARDNFTGRSTVRFGVAEIIDLSFTANPPATAASFGGLQWKLKSGGGTLVAAAADGTGTYTAPGVAASVVLRLEVASGPNAGKGQDYPISIIVPSGAHLTRFTGLRHTNGLAGVGFQGHIFLEPTDVSFANVTFAEGTVNAVASGFYAGFNGIAHPPTGTPLTIGSCNTTTGCQANGMDTVDTNDKGPPFSVGDFVWAIPWQYQAPGAALTPFTTATHHQFTDAVGKASIEKAGAGPFSKNVADPTSTY